MGRKKNLAKNFDSIKNQENEYNTKKKREEKKNGDTHIKVIWSISKILYRHVLVKAGISSM